MKVAKYFLLTCLFLLISACGSTSSIPFGKAGSSVSVIQGELVFYFFCNDVDPWCSGHGDQTLTERRRALIEKYFAEHPQIIPTNCMKGVVLLHGQEGMGYSWVAFKCNN